MDNGTKITIKTETVSDEESCENTVNTSYAEQNLGNYESVFIKTEVCDGEQIISNESSSNFANIKVEPYRSNVNALSNEVDINPAIILKCPCCSITFSLKDSESYKEHLQLHTRNVIKTETTNNDINYVNDILYKCGVCTYLTMSDDEIEAHMVIHKQSGFRLVYICPICKYESYRAMGMRSHVKLLHKMACSDLKVIEVTKQEKTQVSPQSDEIVYNCDFCSYKTKFKKYLRSHMLSHKLPGEVKMYRCEFCSYQSKYKASVKRHSFRGACGKMR